MVYTHLFYAALPLIRVHPVNKTIKINNDSTDIVLTCMADEVLSYYWLKENSNIPNSAVGTMTSSLILVNVTPSDSGRYQCVAKNNHGNTSSNYANLTIEGRYI